MLKKIYIKKIIISCTALFALLLIYIIPKDSDNNLYNNAKQELSYEREDIITNPIFLFDDNNLLALTNVVINASTVEAKAKELLNILITDGSGSSQIPSGFKAVLPSDTQVISVKFNEGILKVNFSKELLDVDISQEEKLIEAIVYTLTSIDGVKNIIIYVDGNVLSRLPKSNIILPSTLNRKFGINKIYNIDSLKNVNKVVIYYIKENNEKYYYVPVTKYVNDERDKIKIVIESLAGNATYNTNLMSFLNSNAKLLTFEQANDILTLNFNQYIFHDASEKKILEEVIYTICLSAADNYDIKKVIFNVNNEKVYDSVLKTS